MPDSRRTFKFDRDGKPNQPLPEIHWRDESHVRGHIEAANRPIELNAAMYTLEQQMFWCPKHGIVWEEPENWELKEEVYDGIRARVIQHEYDHLEGKLFVDKLSPLRKKGE